MSETRSTTNTCTCVNCPTHTSTPTTSSSSSSPASSDLVASLEATIKQLQNENSVLRATSITSGSSNSGTGGGLGMAFKLLDGLKLERDQLKRENKDLREQLNRTTGGAQTQLEALLAHNDLSPSTKQMILALSIQLQTTLATDLARWNLRAPTDAHGHPYDVNRRVAHIIKKLTTPTDTTAATPASHGVTSPPNATTTTNTNGPPTTVRKSSLTHSHPPSHLRTPSTIANGSTDDKIFDDATIAGVDEMPHHKPKKLVFNAAKKLPVDNDIETSPPTMNESSSTPPPNPTSPDSASSAANGGGLSTSLLSDTNRLIFQEDSPLYRQQLQMQRVRVASLFARLDHLSDATSQFSAAANDFALAAETLSAQLAKTWDDIECREVIDEEESIKMEQKRLAEERAAHPTSGLTSPGKTIPNSSSAPIPSLAMPLPNSSGSHSPQPQRNPSTTRPPPPLNLNVNSPPTLTRATTLDSPGSQVDPLSLGFSFGKLSTILKQLATSSTNLAQFLEHILVTSISSLGDKYRSEAKQSMLFMERIMEEYEEKLSIYLKKKHKDRMKLLSMTNLFGKKKMIDEEHMYICALRREMELKRLNHVEVLNTIQTSRRLELIEVVCASYMAFVTFFHEGDFLSQELRPDMEYIQSVLPRRRRFYDNYFNEINVLKENIKLSALPINLSKIFSGPVSLPIGMNAGDWVLNMTNSRADVAPAITSTSSTTSSSSASSHAPDKFGGGAKDIGHASLIYTIPGIGVAASLSKPAQAQGYLRCLTKDGKMWKRRWHVLEKGQFFYLRESAFLQPRLIVNVLTCGARPCIKSDMDFVFELISPTKTMLYQAESEYEMKTWVSVFANSTEYLLSLQQTRNDTEALSKHMDVKTIQTQKHMKQGLLATLRRSNPLCAECSTRDPDWISINLGIMMCIVCSGIHRSLGVHISKVRSIVLDDLDTELLDMMVSLGNSRINLLWEGGAPENFVRPHPGSSREEKEEFIQTKYVKKAWLSQPIRDGMITPTSLPSIIEERYASFFKSIESDDVESLVVHLLQGCDVDWINVHDHSKRPLHQAAQYDAILSCEYLIQNNANPNVEDINHKTPLDYAKEYEAKRVTTRLTATKTKH